MNNTEARQKALHAFSKRIVAAQSGTDLERSKENEAVKKEAKLMNISPNEITNYAMQNTGSLQKEIEAEKKPD